MNKKLYFNDKYIEFIGPEAQFTDNQSFETYNPAIHKKKDLKQLMEDFLDPENNKNIRWLSADFEAGLRELKDHFYYIEAAGGVIEKEGKFLFIRRHNRWDLPKGKLEKNEGIREAAIRECEEECGIKELEIKHQLSSTFHIYPHKKGHALKQSYWFYMQTLYNGELLPQMEEDITEVKWFSRDEIKTTVLRDTYYTISDVVKEAIS